MRLIVVAKTREGKAALLAEAHGIGAPIDPAPALSRVFFVEWPDLESFPLVASQHVSIVEPDAEGGPPPAANSFTIADDFTGGNWGIARHIRRDAPWNVDRIKTPFPSYYRADKDGTGVDVYAIEGPSRLTHNEFGGRLVRIFGSGTDGASSPQHGTAAFSLAIGNTVGFARGSLGWLAEWGAYTLSAMIAACGAVLSHYTGRSGTNRPAVCWVADQRSTTSSGYESAIADLIDAGIVVVSVAGNFMEDMAVNPRYPGVYTDVICVGGMMAADLPYFGTADGTGFGDRVDILAGARSQYSASHTSDSAFGLFSGTSAAEPMVAGVIACMLEGQPRLTGRSEVQAVKAALLANATTGKLRPQPQFGIGMLPDRILYLDPGEFVPAPVDAVAALVTAGGFYYDFASARTFTNSAKTTNVAADNDLVAVVVDAAGTGSDGVRQSEALSPIWALTGGPKINTSDRRHLQTSFVPTSSGFTFMADVLGPTSANCIMGAGNGTLFASMNKGSLGRAQALIGNDFINVTGDLTGIRTTIAVTYDGTTGRVYVNGVLGGSKAIATGPSSFPIFVGIQNNSGTAAASGAIWNGDIFRSFADGRVLSADEIADIHAAWRA